MEIASENKIKLIESIDYYDKIIEEKLKEIEDFINEDINSEISNFIKDREISFPQVFDTPEKKQFYIDHLFLIFSENKELNITMKNTVLGNIEKIESAKQIFLTTLPEEILNNRVEEILKNYTQEKNENQQIFSNFDNKTLQATINNVNNIINLKNKTIEEKNSVKKYHHDSNITKSSKEVKEILIKEKIEKEENYKNPNDQINLKFELKNNQELNSTSKINTAIKEEKKKKNTEDFCNDETSKITFQQENEKKLQNFNQITIKKERQNKEDNNPKTNLKQNKKISHSDNELKYSNAKLNKNITSMSNIKKEGNNNYKNLKNINNNSISTNEYKETPAFNRYATSGNFQETQKPQINKDKEKNVVKSNLIANRYHSPSPVLKKQYNFSKKNHFKTPEKK